MIRFRHCLKESLTWIVTSKAEYVCWKKAILLQLSTIHKAPNSVIYEFLLMLFRAIGKLFLWHDFLKNRELGELIDVATAKKDGLMPMEQFFDRDVNPIEDYNTFTWNGIRKTTKSTSNSPFESGDGQNAVIFIGTNDVQKIGFQATYSGQLIKIRLYWVGSWGKWQTFSLTWLKNGWSGTSRCHPIRQITYNMLIAYNEVFGQH